jgi:hypothetical protein
MPLWQCKHIDEIVEEKMENLLPDKIKAVIYGGGLDDCLYTRSVRGSWEPTLIG